MREVVLDTETTGIEVREGHRIIEIGCVELLDRRLTGRHFHVYINPEREVEEGAFQVHGISDEFLADKPLFADVADEFMDFIRGAQLVIHNAAFDVGFIDAELERLGRHGCVADHCSVVDTLLLARHKHPGQRNTLDALCKRYGVDNSQRELHGALLDAEILADVYLIMTGGQTALVLAGQGSEGSADQPGEIRRLDPQSRPVLPVVRATEEELAAHEQRLAAIEKAAGFALWRQMEAIEA
ncbi:DNA polymerase III subunit epsilon [Halopseudomonas formosensis]|uniref:DNA polymerase III subunit epsilon n=1 Tax=Halopseudomonas formosensis TaxID=1002526 RepID=A0A1I6AGD8_9GAMM|nr:DNA polymerase III subunit epsilon [Halopseudomonas formosensis]MDX9687617.1 DNA polymerase III subunit epsilon [Halopseudomonas formosensis]NLC01016.1 DNA polymerase III subunit epsilon [Halopseudomonas formosensis]SFQ67673.1 DNA polymerase-3 subunit epsilon [Halopseudomonas formosensis]